MSVVNKQQLALAAFTGVIIGAVASYAVFSASYHDHSQSQQQQLVQLQQDNQAQLQQVEQLQQQQQQLLMQIDQLSAQKKQQETEQKQLTAQVAELKQEKKQAVKTIAVQKDKADDLAEVNEKLEKQTELQASMLDKSRQLFDKEDQLKQDLAKLQSTQQKLTAQVDKLTKACELFKQGQSWETKSDACKKQTLGEQQSHKLQLQIDEKQQELQKTQAMITSLGLEQKE